MADNHYMINNGNIYDNFDVIADSTTPNVDQLTDLFALPVPTPTPPIFYDNYANNGYSSSSSPNDIFACQPTVIPAGISQQQQSTHCNYYPAHGQTAAAFFETPPSFKTGPKPGAGHIFVNLVVVDQPVDRCRFRYKAEQGPHGALRAVSSGAIGASSKIQKFVPKVKVDNLVGNGYVVVSLWTNESMPRPHVNELWGSECDNGTCKIKLNAEMTASFPNLGVMRQKEKEIGEILSKKYIRNHEASGIEITEDVKEKCSEKAQREAATMKDCLHCVRLGFQAFIENPDTGLHIASAMVFSNPIYNSQNPGFSELRIAEIDKSSGLCVGGDTVWMRCATKVKRDQIKIRFCDTVVDWESDALFSPNDVYEQILIIFKTPPYHNINMNNRTTVHVRLYRPTDGEYSPPVEFVYLPLDHAKRAKRAIIHESRDPTIHQTPGQWHAAGSPAWNAGPTYHASGPDQHHYYHSGGRYQCKMEPSYDHGSPSSRKRQMTSSCSDCSTGAKIRSLDSGLSTMQSTDCVGGNNSALESSPTIKSPGHVLSNQIKSLSLLEETGQKDKMDIQLEALWSFCENGDMTSLVAANKEVIAAKDDNGNTVLHAASRNKQGFAMKTLLKVLETEPQGAAIVNIQNSKGQTPLHLAVKYGDADCVHYLLKAGADLSVLDSQGNTVAHCMADTFNESVYREILYRPINQHSLMESLNINELNNDGFSALHYAVKKLRLNLVENLLEGKADVNIQERSTGKSALHLAVEVDDLEILQMLLCQEGIDVDKESHDGTTPLQLAVIKKRGYEMVRCLLTSGAKFDTKSSCCFKSRINETDDIMNDDNDNDDTNNSDCEKYSALDLAEYDPLLCQLLKNPSTKIPKSESTSKPTDSRMENHRQSSSCSSNSSLQVASGPPSTSSSTKQRLHTNLQQDFSDELSSLDFLARLRLGKILDKQEKWVKFAEILLSETEQAPQVVECIRVCSVSEAGSPTSFLLDQLEQWPQIKISTMIRALNEMQLKEAVDLLQH